MLGVVIAVAALLVSFALFEGYENALKEVILGANAHVYIFRSGSDDLSKEDMRRIREVLDSQTEISTYAPIILTQALAVNKEQHAGILLRGIEPDGEELPTAFRKYVQTGSAELSNPLDTVIGVRLADQLGVTVGDSIKLVSPMRTRITPMGIRSRSRKFRISGLYQSGMYEYDSRFVFTRLETASQFASIGNQVSSVEIKLHSDEVENADALAYEWEKELGLGFQVVSWIFYNGNLFTIIVLEKWILFIIMSLLVIIASFNVVSATATSLMEHQGEIGILKAYGMTNANLKLIFLSRMIVLATIATAVGEAFGWIMGVFLTRQTLYQLKGDVYFVDEINVHFSWQNCLLVFGVTMLIVALSTLIPLRRISQLKVVEILRG
ncbi:MAG: ABC transporter permease [Candidatus Cloacimonetes bacterium]|nr:ABC transporter permease [Candidatus Cloacimonadota bacterium]